MPLTDPQIRRGTRTSDIYRIRGFKSLFYPEGRLTPENTVTIENVNFTESRTVDKRYGYDQYNPNQITETAAAKAVVGLRQEQFLSGTTSVLVVAGTKVYGPLDTSTAWASLDITDTLSLTDSPDARYVFEFIDDKIVATNGKDETWYWPGTGDAVALTGMQWTTCQFLLSHKNYLLAMNTTEGGTKHSSRVRWCDTDTTTLTNIDITTWPVKHVYDIYEDARPIICASDNFGYALIFKSDGLYATTLTFSQAVVELVITDMRRGFSPISRTGVATHPEFTWVVCRDGCRVVRPDLSIEFVTRDFQDAWFSLNKGRLQYAHSFIREKDHQVRTLLSSASNTTGHDRVLVWDWETGDIFLDKLGDDINVAESVHISNTEYDFFGSYDGYVHQGNDSDQSQDNGTDIDWEVQMAPNDLGHPGRTKTILGLRTILKTQATAASFNVEAIIDQGVKPKVTGELSYGSSLTWNSGNLWDAGLSWPGGSTENLYFFVNRTAENIAPRWLGNSQVGLVGYQVEYQLNEE